MSAQKSLGKCCISGSVHDGTPTGREDTIGGLSTYIAEPSDKSTSKTVVFLVDIFGYKFKNVRLLADNYAKAGFYVYIPDVHEGDSLPIEFLQSVEPPLKAKEEEGYLTKAKETVDVMATLGPWLAKHREGVSEPIISGFINAVRQIPGTNKIGAIGFCWGGRYAILQGHKRTEGQVGGVDAVYAAHPSLLSIPADIEAVTVPTSVAVGEKDSLLDLKSVEQLKETLEKTGVPSEVKIYKDQVHGFALRSDWSSDEDKKAMDDAEKQGIEWFKKYLS
ncbi:esterase/lipase [Exophiala viscosa]|uniref:Esterase/lipase n=1 Tax=Exophiala viscosa TaxID=2486360 RepID=A0AAN6IA99_9EURO|nr:esterase/lipase [Exophiala viscosa]